MMDKIKALEICIWLAILAITPVFGYFVDEETDTNYVYVNAELVTKGYIYARMDYLPEYESNRLYTYLEVTGYKWLALHQNKVTFWRGEDGGLDWSDSYHDVWETGEGTDTSAESWWASNPNHLPGGVVLDHTTKYFGNGKYDVGVESDQLVLVL